MGNSAKRDARKIQRAEQARKVLELRKAGASHDQIADQLKLANRSVSWKLFKAALHEVIREPAQDVLALELDRLDALLLGCWQNAKSGDPHAIDRALRIMDRRAKYLGLDKPIEVSGPGGNPLVALARTLDIASLTDEQIDRIAAGDVAAIAGDGGAREAPTRPRGSGTEGA